MDGEFAAGPAGCAPFHWSGGSRNSRPAKEKWQCVCLTRGRVKPFSDRRATCQIQVGVSPAGSRPTTVLFRFSSIFQPHGKTQTSRNGIGEGTPQARLPFPRRPPQLGQRAPEDRIFVRWRVAFSLSRVCSSVKFVAASPRIGIDRSRGRRGKTERRSARPSIPSAPSRSSRPRQGSRAGIGS